MKRVWIVPALLAFGLALPTLQNGFAIDDSYLIVDNPALRDLRNVPRFFIESWGNAAGGAAMYTRVNAAFWRPLTTTLMAVEYTLFGVHAAPWHAVNVLLHAVVTALATGLCWRVTRSRLGALAAGALFAVHPVHTEVVAAITYQTSLLSATFTVSCLLVLERAIERGPTLGDTIALSVLPALALLAKEDAVSLPLLALARVWLAQLPEPGTATTVGESPAAGSLASSTRRALIVRCLVPIALSTGLALLARSRVVVPSGITYFGDASSATVVRTMLATITLYAELLVAPFRLCVFYDWFIVPFESALSLHVLLGAALCLSWLAGTLLAARRAPQLALASCWLALPLLPVLHFIPILNVAAERFLYLPSLGLSLLCAALIARHGASRLARIGLGLVLCAFAVRSALRFPDWRDDRTLNVATARDFPETPTPLLNLAELDLRAGDRARARAHLEQALARAPGFPPALSRLRELAASER